MEQIMKNVDLGSLAEHISSGQGIGVGNDMNNSGIPNMHKTSINKFKIADKTFNKTLDPNFFLKMNELGSTGEKLGTYKNFMNFHTNKQLVKNNSHGLLKTHSNGFGLNAMSIENKLKMYSDDKDLNLFKKIVDEYHSKFNYSNNTGIKKTAFNTSMLDNIKSSSDSDDYYNEKRSTIDNSKNNKNSSLRSIDHSGFNKKNKTGFKTLESNYKTFKGMTKRMRTNSLPPIDPLNKLSKKSIHKPIHHFDLINQKLLKEELRQDKFLAGEIGVSYGKKEQEYNQIEYALYKSGNNLKKNLNKGVTNILNKILGHDGLQNSLKYIE